MVVPVPVLVAVGLAFAVLVLLLAFFAGQALRLVAENDDLAEQLSRLREQPARSR